MPCWPPTLGNQCQPRGIETGAETLPGRGAQWSCVSGDESRKGPHREARRGLASATYTRDHKPFIWALGLLRGLSPRHNVLDDGHRDPRGLGGVGRDFGGHARAIKDALVHSDDPVIGVIVPRNGKQVEGVVVIGAVDGQERGNKGARSGIPHGQTQCRSEGVGYGVVIVVVTIVGKGRQTCKKKRQIM